MPMIKLRVYSSSSPRRTSAAVNSDHICYMYASSYGDYTTIMFDRENTINVVEDVDEILKKIEDAQKKLSDCIAIA